MDDLPEIDNWWTGRAEDFYEAVQTRYTALNKQHRQGKIQPLYYFPSDHYMLVEELLLMKEHGTLLFKGKDLDGECEAIVQIENAHIVMRILDQGDNFSLQLDQEMNFDEV